MDSFLIPCHCYVYAYGFDGLDAYNHNTAF